MSDPNSPPVGQEDGQRDDRSPVDDKDVLVPDDAELDGSDDESGLVDNELNDEQRSVADDIRDADKEK